MRMRCVLLVIIGVTFLLSSCKDAGINYSPPVFPVTEQLETRWISKEGMLMIYPLDMCVDENYIYVLADVDKKMVQVYNKRTGEYVRGAVSKGQGPGEVITGCVLSCDADSGLFSIHDEVGRKLLRFQVGDSAKLTFVGQRDFNLLNGVVRRSWPLQDGRVLVDGQVDEVRELGVQKRFQLLSGENELIAKYNDFPVEEREKGAFWSPFVSVSPDKTKMVSCILYGGVLETFDLTPNSIRPRATRHFYRPKLDEKTVQATDETVFGFSTVCSSNDKIYTVLIGDKDLSRYNNISVFDWDGNERARYETDCNVLRLCYSEKEPDKLYGIAVSEEEEYYLVSFDIP